MPRLARKKSFTKTYHIVIRGINKQDLFFDNRDYQTFINDLEITKEKYQFEIYAYALMQNHIHFIIYAKNDNLPLLMQSLNVRYSRYFNKKYERTGHVFENRFKSYPIETVEYFKSVLRYIHKNPENAGLKKYQNTSYYYYIDTKQVGIVETKRAMKLFDNSVDYFIYYHENYNKYGDYNKNYEFKNSIEDEEAIEIIKYMIQDENISRIQNFEINKKYKIIMDIMKIERNKY